MIARLGRWCHDRRRLVVVLWIALLVVGNGIAGGIGDAYRQDFSLEGFESTEGFSLVESRFDDGSGSPQSGQIVFQAEQGVDDPAIRAAMEALFAEVAEIDEVTSVQSPYAPGGEFQISTQGDAPGTIAFATVNLPEDIDFTTAADVGDEIRELVPEIDGLRIELGGFLFAEFEQPSAELFGLAFAVVILIVAFGSVLAMGLPVGVALFGIGMGGAFVILASHLMEVPDFAPFVGLMIGLGVGIDYALLIVTRYREQLHAGHDVRESIGIAMDTAGRSVVFAGATVVISLLGMLLMGIGFVGGLGITASLTVAMTVAASITLLPALLGFAGDNIERTKWRGLLAAGFVALALVGAGLKVPALDRRGHRPRACSRSSSGSSSRRSSARCSTGRRSRGARRSPTGGAGSSSTARGRRRSPPPPCCSCWPSRCSSLRLGFSDESNFADDTTTKQAYDLIVEGFGKGSTGPVYLVAEVDGADQVGALAARQRRGGGRPRGGVGPRSAAQRPREPHRRALARHPERAARRTRPRPSS